MRGKGEGGESESRVKGTLPLRSKWVMKKRGRRSNTRKRREHGRNAVDWEGEGASRRVAKETLPRRSMWSMKDE